MKNKISMSIETIRLAREKSYTCVADVKRILKAMETNNWDDVMSSSLYRFHGGEYCELLGILHE